MGFLLGEGVVGGQGISWDRGVALQCNGNRGDTVNRDVSRDDKTGKRALDTYVIIRVWGQYVDISLIKGNSTLTFFLTKAILIFDTFEKISSKGSDWMHKVIDDCCL